MCTWEFEELDQVPDVNSGSITAFSLPTRRQRSQPGRQPSPRVRARGTLAKLRATRGPLLGGDGDRALGFGQRVGEETGVAFDVEAAAVVAEAFAFDAFAEETGACGHTARGSVVQAMA